MSAFHPKATEQRTRFYVGSVPLPDVPCVGISSHTARTSYARSRFGLVVKGG
jgi:hypothetical protein